MAKYNIPSTIPNDDPNAPKMRVEEELKDLQGKIERLTTFIKTENWEKMPEPGRGLLLEQLAIMKDYADILADRLECW